MPMPFTEVPPVTTVELPDRTWPDVVLDRAPIWCSTDLRDGNQALVNPMDAARKRRFFDLLIALGIKEIEVGFPSASKTDFDFVPLARRGGPDPRRHHDRRADAGAPRADRAHLRGDRRRPARDRAPLQLDLRRRSGGSSSGSTRTGSRGLAVRGTALCRELAARDSTPRSCSSTRPRASTTPSSTTRSRSARRSPTEWGPTPEAEDDRQPADDGRGVPAERLRRPDGVVQAARSRCARRDPLSVHPHNDRGTAVATAELGLMAGAERVEGTLFGNGERTGNVDLVTLALNLLTQGVDPRLDLSQIDEAKRDRRGVQRAAGAPAPPVRRRARLHRVLGLAPGRDQEGHGRAGAVRLRRSGTCRTCRSTRRTSAAATRRSSASTRSPARAASRT